MSVHSCLCVTYETCSHECYDCITVSRAQYLDTHVRKSVLRDIETLTVLQVYFFKNNHNSHAKSICL